MARCRVNDQWSWTLVPPADQGPGNSFSYFNPDLIAYPWTGDPDSVFGNHRHSSFPPQYPGSFTWSGEFRKHGPIPTSSFYKWNDDLLAKKLLFAKGVCNWFWCRGPGLDFLKASVPYIVCLKITTIRQWLSKHTSTWNRSHSSSANKWETSLIELKRVVLSGNQEASWGFCHHFWCQLSKKCKSQKALSGGEKS